MTGQGYKNALDSSILNLVIQGNSNFMYGDHFIMMKTQAIDAYVNRIKQVAALLNYGKPQILGLFRKTLPSRLYWIIQ